MNTYNKLLRLMETHVFGLNTSTIEGIRRFHRSDEIRCEKSWKTAVLMPPETSFETSYDQNTILGILSILSIINISMNTNNSLSNDISRSICENNWNINTEGDS